jgi:hypothetical protein
MKGNMEYVLTLYRVGHRDQSDVHLASRPVLVTSFAFDYFAIIRFCESMTLIKPHQALLGLANPAILC